MTEDSQPNPIVIKFYMFLDSKLLFAGQLYDRSFFCIITFTGGLYLHSRRSQPPYQTIPNVFVTICIS